MVLEKNGVRITENSPLEVQHYLSLGFQVIETGNDVPSPEVPTIDEMTVPELREVAKARGLRNIAKMGKQDLLTLLKGGEDE